MESKITIFGIELNGLTAKEKIREVIGFMENGPVGTVEVVSLVTLLQEQENPVWKEQLSRIDMVVPGEGAILEAAGITDERLLTELKNKRFLRLFIKYLQRNRKRVFLLAGSEEELFVLQEIIKLYGHGVTVAGSKVMTEGAGKEEYIINEINGLEPDCIFSALPSPWQENFISGSRGLLNARLWFGCGTALLQDQVENGTAARFRHFIMEKVFRYQVVREQKEQL